MSVETTTPSTIEDRSALPLQAKDFKGDVSPDWCPGCGDFGVLTPLFAIGGRLIIDNARARSPMTVS